MKTSGRARFVRAGRSDERLLGRACKGALLLAVAVGVSAGCNEHPVEPLDRVVTAANRQETQLPPKTKIDFVFMIDNSGSMCEEQRALTQNFQLISDYLFDQLGAAADYRIAVVSSDMHPPNGEMGRFLAKPAEPVPSLNCLDRQTGAPLTPDTEDCFDPGFEIPTIIQSGPEGNIGRNCGDAADPTACQKADLEKKFRCMATLGVQGDGFEKGLESMRYALSCNGPNRALFGQCCEEIGREGDNPIYRYNPSCYIPPDEPDPAFLRPDAILVLVFITDEDDCSDPALNPRESTRAICKYGPGGDGVIPAGYSDREICGDRSPSQCFIDECLGSGACQGGACAGAGEVCVEGQCVRNGGTCYQQRCQISRSENSNCYWFRNDLVPVQEYYNFLVALKPNPAEQLLVAAITGVRDYTPNGDLIFYEPGEADTRCMECLSDVSVDGVCRQPSPNYDPNVTLDECCPNGKCRGRVQPSCASDFGVAFAGHRYLELTDLFSTEGQTNGIGCPMGTEANFDECVNICVNDFSRPLEVVRDRLDVILASYCLEKRPACQVPVREVDGQIEPARPCETAEEREDLHNYPIRVRRQCLTLREDGGRCERIEAPTVPTVLADNEWTLSLDEPGCSSGSMIRLSPAPPAGSEVYIEFLVEVGTAGRQRSDAGVDAASEFVEIPEEDPSVGE